MLPKEYLKSFHSLCGKKTIAISAVVIVIVRMVIVVVVIVVVVVDITQREKHDGFF